MPEQPKNNALDDDDLLAPPPFGVAETTGNQLLPIATSMEDLPEVRAELSREDFARPPESLVTDPSIEVPAEDPPAIAGSGSSRMPLVVIGLLLVGALVGGWWWLNANAGSGQAEAPKVAEAPQSPKNEASPTPAPPPAKQPAGSLPTSLSALRAMTYEERHAALATATGSVPVELHVGLDLIQARETENPCQTFSDALATIESSADRAAFAWALEEADVPGSKQGESECADLQSRVDVLMPAKPDAEAPRRARTTRPRRSSARPKPVEPSPEPAKPQTPQTPSKPAAPAKSETSSKGVATKLDDELRGLGG